MNSNEEKQALNLDGRIATPEEIAAGLSTKNAFDMCQVKLGRSLSYEELSADIPQYDGASPEIAYDYAHGVYNKENEAAYLESFFRAQNAIVVDTYGKDVVERCPEVMGEFYQDLYAAKCSDTPNLLIDEKFIKQMMARFGETAGVEKGADALQKYSPQAVNNDHYGELVAKHVKEHIKPGDMKKNEMVSFLLEEMKIPEGALIRPMDDSHKKIIREKIPHCIKSGCQQDMMRFAKTFFNEEQIQQGFILYYTNHHGVGDAALFTPNLDNKKEWITSYNDGFGWRPSGKMKKITGSDLKIIQAATGKLKQQAR